jgi:hypothetical protein
MDIRQGARQAVQQAEWFLAAVTVALSWLVVAVVVMLALASPAAQGQVLDSYTACAASNPPVCSASNGRARLCRASTRKEVPLDDEAFLQWAVAMHRAAASDAGIVLRSVRPATVMPDRPVPAATGTRKLACSS